MNARELKDLSRKELLEMLLRQTKRVEELEAQLLEKQMLLEERRICIEESGSIAQAALQLNGVFEASQKAADQYLENIERLWNQTEAYCAAKRSESEELVKRARELFEGAQTEQEPL